MVLENVAHFFRHDLGKTYLIIKGALESLGYNVAGACLSPHHFGIPQIRERMYLVASLHDLSDFRWPEATTRGEDLDLRAILEKNPTDARALSSQQIDCINIWEEFLALLPRDEIVRGYPIWGMEFGATYPYKCGGLDKLPLAELRRYRGILGQKLNFHFRSDIYEHLPSHAMRFDNPFPSWKVNFIRKNRRLYSANRLHLKPWISKLAKFPPSLQKFEWHGDGKSVWNHIIQFRASGVRVKRPTTAPSLVAMTTSQVPIIGWERRYMTMRECSALQSLHRLRRLPTGRDAVTALGNAVNASVAGLVISHLLDLPLPKSELFAPALRESINVR